MAASDVHDQLMRDGSVSRTNNERFFDNSWHGNTNVGLVGKANDDETEPKSAGKQIEEIAGTGVNVLTNGGRAILPDDANELL